MKRIQMGYALGSLLLLLLAACAGDAASEDPGSESANAEAVPPVTAGQELPADHPTISAPDSSSTVVPPAPGSGQGSQGLTWTQPAGWQAETPSSSMRRAQYRIPGPAGDAECVVYYFGPGQGGDAQDNVLRWADQFGQTDGKSSRDVLVREELEVDGIPVLLAEVKGIYSGGMTGTGPQTPRPSSMLLGAVAQGPDANWFFKLTGPEATVAGNRQQFRDLVQSLRTGG